MFSSAFFSVLLLTLLSHLVFAAPAPGSKVSPSLGVSCKATADCKDGLICSTKSSTCSYSVVVRQASGGVPDDWTCNPGWYNTDDGCDCGCGITDPDCNKEDQSLFCQNSDRSSEDSRCDLDQNVCVAKPPEEWTCTENWYDTSDGCDCGCGATDPDCVKEDQFLFCPNSDRDSSDSRCDFSRNICVAKPPDEWTCTENWYDTSDGCDCGCGATDPDCDKEDQSLFCANSSLSGSESSCDFTTNKCVPNEWTCNMSWYNTDDGCDCGCGATDPDCKEDGMTLFCHNSPLRRLESICNLETNECELNPSGAPRVEAAPRPRRPRSGPARAPRDSAPRERSPRVPPASKHD